MPSPAGGGGGQPPPVADGHGFERGGRPGCVRYIPGCERDTVAVPMAWACWPPPPAADVLSKRPTPTQSTCLYYDHDNEASKCVCYHHGVWACVSHRQLMISLSPHVVESGPCQPHMRERRATRTAGHHNVPCFPGPPAVGPGPLACELPAATAPQSWLQRRCRVLGASG